MMQVSSILLTAVFNILGMAAFSCLMIWPIYWIVRVIKRSQLRGVARVLWLIICGISIAFGTLSGLT